MGATNSRPINNIANVDTNILQSIKSKEHSVVSFNDNPQVFNRQGNVMVNELKLKDEKGNMCQKLPVQSVLKNDNTINKNIFITADNKHIRLYADKKCRIRANEEAYATVSKPESDLFNPHLSEQAKLGSNTNFTFIPYKSYQNAHYYKITDVPINTPRLPQFYIKDKGTGNYLNKQFVEFDDGRTDVDPITKLTIPKSVCRKIPMTNPTDYNIDLDYRFQPQPGDALLTGKYGREVGIDRFPDELNTNSNATNPDGTPIKFLPISVYSDVVRDINDNVFDKAGNLVEKNENNEPIINDDDTDVTCGNIYTNDNTKYPISAGYRLKDKLPNNSIPDATPNQATRYIPLPYTRTHNYGTLVADRAKGLYYELKTEKGLLD
jgi:hypothetical protein